ncbi:MAG: allantoicase [Deltaproteobacteria bacterium]|nr:allantoicase [Deltaproteobacteria bacterium]
MSQEGDFRDLVDLAAERLGGAVLWANDDFFAPKENLLKASKPVWLEHEYTDRGKWMDGWESRRRRVPGHDTALLRLGLPGVLRGLVVDTSFFRGNYPESCAVEGTTAPLGTDTDTLLGPTVKWFELLPRSALMGDSQNPFAVTDHRAVTHLKLHIFPDGGVARLRVHGAVLPDWSRSGGTGGELDLAAVEHGGEVLTCSDMFFGPKHNLILPGRGVNMGDGWETRRRRGPGHDWVLLKLGAPGTLRRVEVDTNHFKGNYPDTCSLDAILLPDGSPEALTAPDAPWRELLPRTKLQAHTRHFFTDALRDLGRVSHVRLNVYPDGGVSRLRLHGTVALEDRYALGLRRLEALPEDELRARLASCCGASRWLSMVTEAMVKREVTRVEGLFGASDAALDALDRDGWLEAFRAHPRIGEKKAEASQSEQSRRWSSGEQSGMDAASEDTVARLAEANRAYDQRFGQVFIVCATGRSARELLSLLEARLGNDPATELRVASEEQKKITRLRLEKLLLG